MGESPRTMRCELIRCLCSTEDLGNCLLLLYSTQCVVVVSYYIQLSLRHHWSNITTKLLKCFCSSVQWQCSSSKAGRFQCTTRTYLKRGVPIQRTVRTLSESMCQCQLWDITSFNKSYPQTWSVVKLSEKGTKPSSRLSVSWRKVRNLTLDYLCEASFYVGLDSSKVSLILKEILVFSFF